MILAFFFAALAILGVGCYAWSQARSPVAQVFHAWRCPRCDKKVRYPASQAGRAATCPACKRRVILPAAPQAAPGAGPAEEGFRVRRKPCAPARRLGAVR